MAALALAAAVTVTSRAAQAQTVDAPATPPHALEARRVLVHIDGAPGAVLQMDRYGDHDWTTVCSGSCDVLLPLGPMYRIDGDGMRRSSEFQIAPPLRDRVTLDVTPASSARFAWGVALVPIGVLTFAGGYVANLFAALGSAGGSEPTGEPGPPNYTPGTTLMVVGVIALLGGVVLSVHDWATGVVQPNDADPASVSSLPSYPGLRF